MRQAPPTSRQGKRGIYAHHVRSCRDCFGDYFLVGMEGTCAGAKIIIEKAEACGALHATGEVEADNSHNLGE